MNLSNSVFISYRRSVSGTLALAVYQDLSHNQIDVFYDITSLDAGQFDTAILRQIAARPYFVPILTPGTLERCKEPGDWVLREIEEALRLNRMILPLHTPEFNFGDMDSYLPPDVARELKRYQAVEIPYKYFQYAMQDVRTRYLKPIDRPTTPTPAADISVIGQKQALAQVQPTVADLEMQAQEHLDKGMALQGDGSDEAAIVEYTEAIRLNPRLAEAYARRAGRYRALGNETAAWRDLEDALRIDPQNASAYINRGNARKAKGDLDAAIADYSTAIQLNPQYVIAYINRGNARRAKGDLDAAIADYNQAISLNPQDALAYYNRGLVRYDKGDLDAAIADYNQAISLNPQDAEAYNNRGNARKAKGDLDAAIADYSTAIQLNPQYADTYYNRGNARKAKGDLDDAIADYSEAIRLNPKDALAYRNRGLAYEKKGDKKKAAADYRRVLELRPDHPRAQAMREFIKKHG